MPDERIGLRVELTQDIQMHKAGHRGVIGEKAGYVGVVFDGHEWGLVISHAGMPITNYVKIIEDERAPVAEQMRLF